MRLLLEVVLIYTPKNKNKNYVDKMRSHGCSGGHIWWSLLAHGSKLLTTNATGVLTVLSAINIKKCCCILQQTTELVWDKRRFRVNLSKLIYFWFIPMCPTRTCFVLQKLWQICCYLYIRFCNSFICHSGETPAKIGMDYCIWLMCVVMIATRKPKRFWSKSKM